MKKICFLFWALTACLFSACFDDDGNYSYVNVDDIVIEGLGESHSRNSYNGEVLEITPTVTSPYTDLVYEWYMWSPDKEAEGNTNWDPNKPPYEAELISTDAKLAYPVECPIGLYTIMLKVSSKSSGYFNIATTKFEAQTMFTRGFYILKETADGNTELDLYDRSGNVLSDLLTITGHGPMSGKPLSLGALPSHSLLTETNEMKVVHSMCVTTQDKQIAYFNTENLAKVHDEKDIIVGGLEEGEVPYTSFSFGYSNYLLTSRGCNVAYVPNMMGTSGAIGIPAKTGGASEFVMSDGSMAVIYWNKEEQRIDCADNMAFGDLYTYNENGFSTTGMECLMCGFSQPDGKGYFLLKDANNTRYLYEVIASGDNPKTAQRVEITPDQKLYTATAYAVNARTTNLLYFVSGNQLYRYTLPDYTEQPDPLKLDGIGSDETITYLSYQWQNFTTDEENNFTHLVVGTQKGDDYKLYMYDIEAGVPKALVKSFGGKGKLKMCVYMSSVVYDSTNWEGKVFEHSLPN